MSVMELQLLAAMALTGLSTMLGWQLAKIVRK